MSPRAYDLIGDVTSRAEIFPRLEALEEMANRLRRAGFVDAEAETRKLVEESREFARIMEARTARLQPLWKALEMADLPHTPAAGKPEKRPSK